MSWFLSSVFAAIFLAFGFLLVKKASLGAVTLPVTLFYLWGIASIALLGYLLYTQAPLQVAPAMLWVLLGAAILTLLGNLFLYHGVYTAPNPGYATAIGSIQVLIVVLLSILLFGAELSALKIFATMLVLIGVILLGL